MKIPHWVDARKRKKTERASARLKYVLGVIAATHTGRQSMRALAEKVGMDHSTLSTYIRRGAFSVAAAQRIECTFGRDVVTCEFLLDPLSIATKTPG